MSKKNPFFKLLLNAMVLPVFFATVSCSQVSDDALKNVAGYTENTTIAPVTDPSLTGLTMSIVGGNYQIAAPGAAFADPYKVQVLYNGNPLSGKTVNFAFTTAVTGTMSSTTATTDATGFAEITLTAGASSGTLGIQALYQSATVNFSSTVIDQTGVTIEIMAGNSQSATVNNNYTNPLKVLVKNSTTSLPAPNIIVTFLVTGGNSKINGTANTLNVTTDILGVASINLQAGTIAGVDSVKAMVAGNVAQFVTFNESATTSPALFSLTTSTLGSSLAAVVANGADTSTLTFTLKDAYSNTLSGPTGTVAFSASAGVLLGGVTNVGDGRYTQVWRAPSSGSGTSVQFTATYNASAITDDASIYLSAGAYSITNSTVTASSIKVTADGTSFSLITVTLKDTLGNQVTSGGESVSISKTGEGVLLGSVNDVGDGTYTQVLRSNTTPGSATVSATVNGAPLGSTVAVSFVAGAANATTSILSLTQSIIPPNDSTLSLITLTTRDVNNNLRNANSNGGTPTVTFTTTLGTLVGSATNNGDGTFQQYIKSAVPGTATIQAVINGTTTTASTTIYFNSQNSTPSTQFSTVTLVGAQSNFPANGVATVTVKATIKTTSNTQFTTGGNSVVFSTTAGTLTGPVSDNGDGTYTQTLTAPNSSASNVVVSATVDGNNIANTALVNFYGAISLAQSTMTATYSYIEGNGSTTTLIILQAKDSSGIAIPTGGQAGITFGTTSGTLLATASDNGNGTYTQVLQSSVGSNTATVSAQLSGAPFSATKAITFFVANNWIGLTMDCTADDGTGTFATAANSITKRIRLWGNNIVVDNGSLTMNTRGANGYCPNSFSFGNVNVKNNGNITHTTIGSGSQSYAMEFTADSLSVDGTSSIHANSKGLRTLNDGTYRVPTGTSSAPTFADSTVASDGSVKAGYAGASYGGEGYSTSGTPNGPPATYGSLYEPNDPGSGNGAVVADSNPAGGTIKITVTGIATINGNISSNGSSATVSRCMQGSGGSVWLNVGTLDGSGTVNALGGNALSGCVVYNPGGGGRIAIYYSNLAGNFAYGSNLISNVRAYGGYIWNATTTGGAAGTIYLKSSSQTYGDLLINNNNVVTTGGSATTIRAPTITTPDTVTANTITKATYFKEQYKSDCAYKNQYVHANTVENATLTRMDDTYFQITSCDANNLQTSSGSMTAAPLNATTASSFETFMIFDHIEIVGKARVKAPHLVALSGSISDTSKGIINGILSNGMGAEFIDKDLQFTNSVGGTVALNAFPFRNASKNISLSGSNFSSTTPIVANDLVLSGTTLNMIVPRGTQSITLSGALNITNTSNLTHQAAVNTRGAAEYWLDVAASSLNLDATSTVNVSGKGYNGIANAAGCTVVGNILVNNFLGNTGASMNAGASHGGYGSSSSSTAVPNLPYGSVTNPNTPGGICVYSTSNPVAGGGVARFSLGNGNAVIDGNIQANGTNIAGSVSYGSAGGSVYINAGYVNGTGYLAAIGGYGSHNAGSGGRIAVHYTSLGGNFTYPTNFIANVRAYGTTAAVNAFTSSPGTIFARDKAQTYGDVIINNNNISYGCGTNAPRCGAAIISPARSAISTVTSSTVTYSASSIFQEHGQNSNAVEGFAVVPNINEVATTSLNDHTYFPISFLSSATITSPGTGITSVGANGNTSAFPFVVNNLQFTNGGVLYLNENMIVRNGDVTSNDTTSFTVDGGATGTGRVELPGVTSLNISQSGSVSQPYFSPLLTNSTTSVTIGSNTNLSYDTASTINGNLTMNGSAMLTVTAPLTINGNVTMNSTAITNVGSASYSPNLIVSGDININNTAQIKGIASTQTVPSRMYITAANINIGATAKIMADGLGGPVATGASPCNVALGSYYPISETAISNFGTVYRTTGAMGWNCSDNPYANSGSYGGMGGDNTGVLTMSAAQGPTLPVYGNLYLPNEPGIGGGAWNGNAGSVGGGAIRLGVTGTITNNGKISANGADTSGTRTSTGSGGGIVIQTNTLTGTGSISANGGNQTAVTDYSTGGGGRIAIYYTTASGNFVTTGANPAVLSNVLATGGSGSQNTNNTRTGAAGTIYLKSSAQTYGDLVINNTGYNTSATTYFDAPVAAANSNITLNGTSINKVTQFGYGVVWPGTNLSLPNKWTNFYVNPNTAQNATTSLDNDTLYKIVSSTGDSIIVNSDVSGTAGSGNTYKLVMVFDHLEVRQKGNIYAPNMNIRVLSGDLSSGTGTTFNQDGIITAGVVDVGAATWNGTANATGSTITNRCGVAGTIAINCP